MRLYIAVTGSFFLIITTTHIFRAFVEEGMVRDGWFILATTVAATFAGWALLLLRRSSGQQSSR